MENFPFKKDFVGFPHSPQTRFMNKITAWLKEL